MGEKIILLLSAFLGVFLHTSLTFGNEGCQVKGKISFGSGNLIIKRDGTRVSRSLSNIHVDSKLPLFCQPKRMDGILRLQNGCKLISGHENILLNQADLELDFLILPRIVSEILGEVKHKGISMAETSSIESEYGYLSWQSGLALTFHGNNFRSTIRYLHHQHKYADESFFDSKDHQIQVITTTSFSRELTGRMVVKMETATFSRQQEYLHEQHTGTLYEISLGSQWIHGFLINPGYAFQRNKSDRSEYSFSAHQFSIHAAFPLYWRMTFQCYGRWRLCEYESQEYASPFPPDEDNAEQSRNELALSLSKDILKNYSLEVRYLLSQMDLSSSYEKYHKQTYSLIASYVF
jgi:hypothetical protein